MSSQTVLRSPLLPPITCVVDQRLLPVQATVDVLPLHHFVGHRTHWVRDVAPLFEEFPHCPGILVFDHHQFEGMVSRSQLLEWLLNPSLKGFDQPLALLLRMARTQPLVIPATTLVHAAATQLLARWRKHSPSASSPLQQSDPVVVQFDDYTYRLLDSHVLLQSAWQIQEMANRIQLEKTRVQMIQTEKMASLGRLVNGVAHEILDPVGFIWGNLCHISDYTQDILQLIHRYEAEFSPLPPELIRLREEVELDYLQQDLPKAIASIQSGADRLKKLATSLQTFCYIDEVYPKPADINHCLDGIIFLIETRLSGEIEIVRNYSYLPPVTCYVGQLSYVFTNLLTKAVNTLLNQISCHQSSRQSGPEIDPEVGPGRDRESQPWQGTSSDLDSAPKITITTQVWTQHFDDLKPEAPSHLSEERTPPPLRQVLNPQQEATVPPHDHHRWVSITIADNGPPLSDHEQQQLLALLSNHQPMDEETSLALSYRIVADKHDGKLLVRSPLPPSSDSPPGAVMPPTTSHSSNPGEDDRPRGTAFQVLLPID
ncbi:MAG: sensor histidine kinase [Leptolyngbyaceae cyanobacterium]